MTPAMLVLLPQLIAAGLATEQQIAALINTAHPGLSTTEQATILQFVVSNSDKYITLLEKDKGPQVA